MADIAARVPLGDAARRLLAEAKPRGTLNDFDAQWQGPLDAPEHYQVKGALSGLALAVARGERAARRRPARAAQRRRRLRATESGGEARLALKGGAIEFPGVFADPLVPLDQLERAAGLADRARQGRGRRAELTVQVKDARFANADARGEFSATWRTGDPAARAAAAAFRAASSSTASSPTASPIAHRALPAARLARATRRLRRGRGARRHREGGDLPRQGPSARLSVPQRAHRQGRRVPHRRPGRGRDLRRSRPDGCRSGRR